VKLPNETIQWVSNISGANTVQLTGGVTAGAANYTFLACGPLGAEDVLVEGAGTLAGTSGVGGDLTVSAGGTFSPGTFEKPIAEFHVGGDLVFNGGSWQVDIDATSKASDVVHVAGSIELNGGVVEPVFHNSVKPRPKGVWDIATYEGVATGKMSGPKGCKTVIDETNKIIQLVSAEAGTLLMVR